jgi:hypothetical protein
LAGDWPRWAVAAEALVREGPKRAALQYHECRQNIAAGDFASLSKALEQIGISDAGIKALSDIQATEHSSPSGLGEKAKGWLADVGKYLGKEGAKVGIEVAKRAAMKWLMQYYGLDI